MELVEKGTYVYEPGKDVTCDCTRKEQPHGYKDMPKTTGYFLLETQKNYSKDTGTYHASIEMISPRGPKKRRVFAGFQSLCDLNCEFNSEFDNLIKMAREASCKKKTDSPKLNIHQP